MIGASLTSLPASLAPVLLLWQPWWLPPWFSDWLSMVLPQGICSCCSLSLACWSFVWLIPTFHSDLSQMTPPGRSQFWPASLRSSCFLSLSPWLCFFIATNGCLFSALYHQVSEVWLGQFCFLWLFLSFHTLPLTAMWSMNIFKYPFCEGPWGWTYSWAYRSSKTLVSGRVGVIRMNPNK